MQCTAHTHTFCPSECESALKKALEIIQSKMGLKDNRWWWMAAVPTMNRSWLQSTTLAHIFEVIVQMILQLILHVFLRPDSPTDFQTVNLQSFQHTRAQPKGLCDRASALLVARDPPFKKRRLCWQAGMGIFPITWSMMNIQSCLKLSNIVERKLVTNVITAQTKHIFV